MSDMYGITAENLMRTLPAVLARDENLRALGEAAAEALENLEGDIGQTLIYPRAGELPEDLLNILAEDFKIDWWDPNYPVETKRALFRDSWRVHRLLGTPEAVNLVIRAVFGEGHMTAWYEYGGSPHHFRVEANNTGIAGDDWIGYFMRFLAPVKRLTSWLDGITVSTRMPEDTAYVGGAMASVTRLSIPELKKAFAGKSDIAEIQTAASEAIKGAKLVGNTIKFFTDKAMSGSPAFTVDFPAELVLDQANTKFVGSFAWSLSTYPGSTNPSLDGKPVMVLAVKGGGANPNYSFLDMQKLVDTYTAGTGDESASVTVSGYKISVKVNISKTANNQLQLKSDGLYVPKPGTVDISGKADKVAAAASGDLAGLDVNGNLVDSGINAADVLTAADIQDFSEEEIAALLSAEE